MARIRWYGPTLTLLVATLIVMIVGPELARRITHVQTSEEIRLVRDSLSSNPSLAELSDAFRKVGKVIEPSVVHIQVYTREAPRRSRGSRFFEDELHRWFFDRQRPDPRSRRGDRDEERERFEKFDPPQPFGNGSGWVFDEQGHIVTNNHVINDADEITVRFYDGSEREATVKGVDVKTDIAVLKVDTGDLHRATRALEPVEQGDIVFAFGSPFRFEFSMSQGIVSGLGRKLNILGQHGYERFIQTDASINPGNSGGPLANIRGEVVGMNTAIASRSGFFNGVGFAIPIDMVESHVEQIIEKGKVTRGYLGVYIGNLDSKMARTFGFDREGVLVQQEPIPDGPAESAGIQRGDIITKIDDTRVTTADELRDIVAGYAPGTRIEVELYRVDDPSDMSGRLIKIGVKIGVLPDQVAMIDRSYDQKEEEVEIELLKKLGFERVVTYTEDLAENLSLEFRPGVFIESIRPRSAAAAVRIEEGSIISHVMGVRIESVRELTRALEKHDLNVGVRVSIVDRRGMTRFVLLELSDSDD